VAGTSSATGGALTGSSGDELLISSGAGSFTYPGTISKTGTNKAVNVTGKSGGTVTLSGQITDTGGTGGGVSLTSNSGATIGLTVTGDSGSANNGSGGTIQRTSSDGIALTSTRGASFDQMNIQNTGGSGVRGFTAVQDFTFTNGTINNSGTGGGNQESSIAFN